MAKTIIRKDSILTTGASAYVVSIGDTYIVEESVIVAAGDGHAGILMVEDAHLILKGLSIWAQTPAARTPSSTRAA